MGHVRLFGGWLDGAKTRYWVYEQTPPKAVYAEYTWSGTYGTYLPYRYNNIVESPATDEGGPMQHQVRYADGNWSGFQPLPGYQTTLPGDAKDVAITGTANGSAQVLIIGTDDRVYHQVRHADGNWTGFQPLPGMNTTTPAAGKNVAITGLSDGSAQVLIVGR